MSSSSQSWKLRHREGNSFSEGHAAAIYRVGCVSPHFAFRVSTLWSCRYTCCCLIFLFIAETSMSTWLHWFHLSCSYFSFDNLLLASAFHPYLWNLSLWGQLWFYSQCNGFFQFLFLLSLFLPFDTDRHSYEIPLWCWLYSFPLTSLILISSLRSLNPPGKE